MNCTRCGRNALISIKVVDNYHVDQCQKMQPDVGDHHDCERVHI